MSNFTLPTETVELPSKGLLYPESNPLSSGKVEMKYMTAKEEDILTNISFIENGTVIDKLLQSLIVSKINYEDLLIGDKNALTIASRILGYGKDYDFTYDGEKETIDLTTLKNKKLNKKLYTRGVNKFKFTLPSTETEIEFKLLTQGDERKIEAEIKGLKKLSKTSSTSSSTRLKHSIISVEGNETSSFIREFVDKAFLVKDIRAFRKYVVEIQPDVDIKYTTQEGREIEIPIGVNFFYPEL